VEHLTGQPVGSHGPGLDEDPQPLEGLHHWLLGDPADFNRAYCLDLAQLSAFIHATQPTLVAPLDLANDSPTRRQFLARLQGEITRRGVIDVLRKGVQHGQHNVALYYATASAGNERAALLHAANRFVVTRQLRYSDSETQNALDLAIFINGLPLATFELKNSLTKQTVADAVEQYKRDRNPNELIFQFGRCMAHFAVDDAEVMFCTDLKSKWFLPFNRGWNDGAGNPPNPDGLKTDYLWKDILSRARLVDIIEHYAQIVEETDPKTGRKKRKQIFPRFHQLEVVRRLLDDTAQEGAGKRYLIMHSAGSGKSNSIAWLAHQLTSVRREGRGMFDTIIVVTDRTILDDQIKSTIKQFDHVGSSVGHADRSGDLRRYIAEGKRIVITTVQKFPFIVAEIGSEHRGRTFAIIIDEAHSSQGGKTAGAMNQALAALDDAGEDVEDLINREMEGRKLLPNASYFAFTATPKNKTLEIFGSPYMDGEDEKFRPFHSYTMKQAIEEGFIRDVLRYYTPVSSYYKLVKTATDDPEFDTKKAKKKLRRYVESHDHAIRLKAEIMVDHFDEQVIALNKIGGEARAMVVTDGIERAIQYFHHISAYLQDSRKPYRAIVAFSGEHDYEGQKVTEASLNGFPSRDIADRIQEDPYRFLICADKFQTGYDEPLLHTMYVDKALSNVKAVQTLSRLNRAHPKKHDTFVLDFRNDVDAILAAFEPYYRTTILSQATDPNKLHDLKRELDEAQVYSQAQVEELVAKYLKGADRPQLDPILDACVAAYIETLDEDGQVRFKGKAKAFVRTYGFLSAILPYTNADWEKLSIFLNLLVNKLPAPKEEDLSKGILEAIDMDSYRVEKKAVQRIQLADTDVEIDPVPTDGGGGRPEPELDRLSNILQTFNELFGNIEWTDNDRIRRRITEEIPAKVAGDRAYQNAMRNSDKQNARIEGEAAVQRVMNDMMADETDLFARFQDDPGFRRSLIDYVFRMTYSEGGEKGAGT
jgi:type I restriction enzyme R subunit